MSLRRTMITNRIRIFTGSKSRYHGILAYDNGHAEMLSMSISISLKIRHEPTPPSPTMTSLLLGSLDLPPFMMFIQETLDLSTNMNQPGRCDIFQGAPHVDPHARLIPILIISEVQNINRVRLVRTIERNSF
jgi:hypothetical protein